MFLAIKENIEKVYRLNKPDIKNIEAYLNGVSHSRFKKQKAAYDWVGIEMIQEVPRFQECINDLKKYGIIPKDNIVISSSQIQNIEDDEKRKEYYIQRNENKKEKTINRNFKKTKKRENEKDYSKIYATEEDESKTIKKMPGEFTLDTIIIGGYGNCREYFLWYIASGGDQVACGDFKGKVLEIRKNKGILFKRIYLDFFEGDGTCIEGKEDHVWIFDDEEFLKMGIKVGDCVKFNALAYAYKRQDGSIDFGLKSPTWIQYIHDYKLPSEEQLEIQSAERIACELCMFNKHCNGFCIAAPDYKEEMVTKILSSEETEKTFIDESVLNNDNKLKEAYQIIEDYYDELYNYSQDSNNDGYDVDVAYTKDKLEQIIINKFQLSKEGINTLKEILNDTNDTKLINAINLLLNTI